MEKLPKTQQVQKLVDKLETEHANNAEKLSDGHMALLTQLLTLSEAAFKRQSIDVFNSQSQRSKQFLWIASLVIAADFALLNLSLTFFENPAIESIAKSTIALDIAFLLVSIVTASYVFFIGTMPTWGYDFSEPFVDLAFEFLSSKQATETAAKRRIRDLKYALQVLSEVMKNNEVRTARLSRIGLLIRVAVGCTFCAVSMMFAVRLEMLWSQL